jgi:hypothetical protein
MLFANPCPALPPFQAAWYKKVGVAPGSYEFMYEGHKLNDLNTVKMAEIDQESVVDAITKQTGGGLCFKKSVAAGRCVTGFL